MSHLKIFTIDSVTNSRCMVPEIINYNHLGLFKKKYSSHGLLNKVEYYRYFDGENYSDLILEEEYDYGFTGILLTSKTTTVRWYDEDNEIAYQLSFLKRYMSWEIINAGIERRSNIIADIKIYVLSILSTIDAYDFLFETKNEVDIYINGFSDPLINKILDLSSSKPYITGEMKDEIINQLNIP